MVDETQPLSLVERKKRHVDLFHDLANEGRRLPRIETVGAKNLTQRVDLGDHTAEHIGPGSKAPAKGEVPLPQRAKQVGDRLQRAGDATVHEQRQAQPATKDQGRQAPRHLGSKPGAEEQYQRGDRAGQSCTQRKQSDLKAVTSSNGTLGHPLPLRPNCCIRR